jgi:DNA modification methylase
MTDKSLREETRRIDELTPYARNSRIHSDGQVALIKASLMEFGWGAPVLVDENNMILAGHGRVMAARKLMESGAALHDWPDNSVVPVRVKRNLSDAQKRAYVILDNKHTDNSDFDTELLSVELADLQALDFDLDLLGFDGSELAELMAGDPGDDAGNDGDVPKGSMSDKFLIPPFTVFNAREGWWQERKRSWLSLGIKSEVGRGDNLLQFSDAAANPSGYKGLKKAKSQFGKCLETGIGEKYGREEMNATSIFDPVLCEIAYRWFSPDGGTIIDPFAGGSVRGIVAAKLGRQYIGGELRVEQVEANRQQADEIVLGNEPTPVWNCADSRSIDKTCKGVEADMVFSCPPYADLEVYSDDPKDLSTLAYDEFMVAYREIISKSVGLLKNDRFACFIVGDVRDKKGIYRNFVSHTIQAFEDAGTRLYNEAILVTAVGSLPIRAGRTFAASRKLGKTHQNVLVFVKGDPKKATEACGQIEIDESLFPESVEEGGAA